MELAEKPFVPSFRHAVFALSFSGSVFFPHAKPDILATGVLQLFLQGRPQIRAFLSISASAMDTTEVAVTSALGISVVFSISFSPIIHGHQNDSFWSLLWSHHSPALHLEFPIPYKTKVPTKAFWNVPASVPANQALCITQWQTWVSPRFFLLRFFCLKQTFLLTLGQLKSYSSKVLLKYGLSLSPAFPSLKHTTLLVCIKATSTRAMGCGCFYISLLKHLKQVLDLLVFHL